MQRDGGRGLEELTIESGQDADDVVGSWRVSTTIIASMCGRFLEIDQRSVKEGFGGFAKSVKEMPGAVHSKGRKDNSQIRSSRSPVVLPTIPRRSSTGSRNWPMTSGTD
jgi:hypothetical protein